MILEYGYEQFVWLACVKFPPEAILTHGLSWESTESLITISHYPVFSCDDLDRSQKNKKHPNPNPAFVISRHQIREPAIAE